MVLGLTLIYALLMGGLMTDLSMRQQSLLRAQQTKGALGLADSIAQRSASALSSADQALLSQLISGVTPNPELDDVMIIDPEGRVLAHANQRMVGTRLTDTDSQRIMQGPPRHALLERSTQRFEVMSPVTQANHLLGWVRLSLNPQESEARINEVAQQGMGFAVLAVVLGSIAVYLVAWLFIHRLTGLTRLAHTGTSFEALYRRTRDTLIVVQSLLGLQQRCSQEPQVQRAMTSSRRRIHAMALLHDMLCQTGYPSTVSLPHYIRHLTARLTSMVESGSQQVSIQLDVPDMVVRLESALPLGLLLTELLSNSLLHAFPDKQAGNVRICMTALPNHGVRLLVSDNGVGFACDGDTLPSPPGATGLKLARALADQLGGSLHLLAVRGTAFEAELMLF